jgi:hypothetical protein
MLDTLVALPLVLIWLSAAVRTATHGSPQDRKVAWLGLGLSLVLVGLLALA